MTLFARGFSVAGAVIVSMGILSSSISAGEQPALCDCSCSGYQSLIDRLDRSPGRAANQVDQCGASCAIAWTRCESSPALRPIDLSVSSDLDSDQKANLTALLDRFLSGAGSGDISMHDRFWSDDLVYTSSSGLRYGKDELMAGLSTSHSQPDAAPALVYSAERVRFRVYDQLALLDFVLVATASDGSQQRFLNSGVFKQEGERWRAVNWQATRKAEP